MNKSESIAELATALSAFQGEISDAHKDKSGYGYNYADLSQVLTLARPLLAKNGLSVTQLLGQADEKVTVETVLMHKSGEWISETASMIAERGKGMSQAQAVGSVSTYLRRYGFAAICGIAQTDDDAAVKEPAQPKQQNRKPVYQEQKKLEEKTLTKWLKVLDGIKNKSDLFDRGSACALLAKENGATEEQLERIQKSVDKNLKRLEEAE